MLLCMACTWHAHGMRMAELRGLWSGEEEAGESMAGFHERTIVQGYLERCGVVISLCWTEAYARAKFMPCVYTCWTRAGDIWSAKYLSSTTRLKSSTRPHLTTVVSKPARRFVISFSRTWHAYALHNPVHVAKLFPKDVPPLDCLPVCVQAKVSKRLPRRHLLNHLLVIPEHVLVPSVAFVHGHPHRTQAGRSR